MADGKTGGLRIRSGQVEPVDVVEVEQKAEVEPEVDTLADSKARPGTMDGALGVERGVGEGLTDLSHVELCFIVHARLLRSCTMRVSGQSCSGAPADFKQRWRLAVLRNRSILQ